VHIHISFASLTFADSVTYFDIVVIHAVAIQDFFTFTEFTPVTRNVALQIT